MTTNTEINRQQPENEIQGSVPATVRESSISKRSILTGTFSKLIKIVSSKSNYCVIAIALAILGIIIVKLFFILFL